MHMKWCLHSKQQAGGGNFDGPCINTHVHSAGPAFWMSSLQLKTGKWLETL